MARIPAAEIERIKREVSVQRLVEASGIELKRHGADLIGLCPFHDDHAPSLVISPKKNLWHCLGAWSSWNGHRPMRSATVSLQLDAGGFDQALHADFALDAFDFCCGDAGHKIHLSLKTCQVPGAIFFTVKAG